MRRFFRVGMSHRTPSGFFSLNMASRDRHVYAYGSYPTPSKGDVGLLPNSASTLDWVNKYEKNIIYHATWRVHLYFLLLVAYRNQQRIIQMDSTELQHGMGIAPYLQACHSSLFPNLIDYSIDRSVKNKQKTSIFDDSFLNHWNNMTVSCPVIVNRYDSFLEGRGSGSVYRKELLFYLSACSLGSCDPLLGLHQFFLIMTQALKHNDEFIEKFNSDDEKRAAKRVIELQEKGMFSLASPVYFSPNVSMLSYALQWKCPRESRADAYATTQKILLTGGKVEAKQFLKRFQREVTNQNCLLMTA